MGFTLSFTSHTCALHLCNNTSGSWKLDAPHHKNTRQWNGTAIKLDIPHEVAELLEHHLSWGYSTLTRCSDRVAPTLFLNTSTGNPLKESEAAKLWSRTALDGTGVHFAPHMCRSIFVAGTKDMGIPIKEGMAMVMGSSQNTIWGSIYDKHFNNRQVGEAMAAMPAWRKSMLKKAREGRD